MRLTIATGWMDDVYHSVIIMHGWYIDLDLPVEDTSGGKHAGAHQGSLELRVVDKLDQAGLHVRSNLME